MSVAGAELTDPPKVELLHLCDCLYVEQARQLLRDCLNDLSMTSVEVVDREGDFSSPSILVNGIDVMGAPAIEGASCRLDLPTRERVMSALNPKARSSDERDSRAWCCRSAFRLSAPD
jgi:hypothetical protein